MRRSWLIIFGVDLAKEATLHPFFIANVSVIRYENVGAGTALVLATHVLNEGHE